jgi:ATP-dependent Zn protease
MVMIFLAVVLWKMTQTSEPTTRELQPSYTEFLAQVELRNVRDVTIYPRQNVAEARGELRNPSGRFHLFIAKESIPEVTKALGEQGVEVSIKEPSRGDWANIAINLLPILFIIGLFIFMFRQTRAGNYKGLTFWKIEVQSTPAGAEIYLDDTLVGTTPTTISLSPGPHIIRMANKAF